MCIIDVGLGLTIRLFGSRGQRDILSLSRQARLFAMLRYLLVNKSALFVPIPCQLSLATRGSWAPRLRS